MPHIEVISGPKDTGKRIPLSVGVWVIGRDPGGAMQLLDRRVSRHHLRITYERAEDRYCAEDLNSEAGTLIHGKLISTPVELNDGDQITLGNTTLVFRCDPASHSEPRLKATRQREIPTLKPD